MRLISSRRSVGGVQFCLLVFTNVLTWILSTVQAEAELSDKDKREELDAVINQARVTLMKAHNLPGNLEESDPRVKELVPPFKQQLRAKAKELLIDEEVRRRK